MMSSSVTSLSKRSRAVYRSTQNNPYCQVEGCNVDLKSAKEYHGRHRICEFHSKSPKVVVGGFERRFCQQCSKLHDLSEFDEMKRSCRRRLSDHNARRRRVRPESIQLVSPGLSSALYDQRPQNVLLSGSSSLGVLPHPFPISRNAERFQEPPRFSGNETHNNSIYDLHLDSLHTTNQCLSHVSTPIAGNMLSAHSLLSSSNSWSSNEVGKSSVTPMEEQLVHEKLSTFRSNYSSCSIINPAEQQNSHVSLVNSVNNFHHQEFRLFKAPYESDHSTFYPTTQRNL